VADAIVRVRVTPGAKRDELAGRRDGALLVRVTAPPVEGRANKAACKLLADAVGIPPSRVEVVRGASSRDKTIRFTGLGPAEAAARLGYS
jgi:uncharacterized protein (TIGR00251 family)